MVSAELTVRRQGKRLFGCGAAELGAAPASVGSAREGSECAASGVPTNSREQHQREVLRRVWVLMAEAHAIRARWRLQAWS